MANIMNPLSKFKLSRRGRKLQISDDPRTIIAMPKEVPERTWQFYRHDPGEEPSSYPPCYIPKRRESWTPDQIPGPSSKDTWAMQELSATETCSEEGLQKWPSTSSLEYPHVDEIPREYWFPGKVNLPDKSRYKFGLDRDYRRKKPLVETTERSEVWAFVQETESTLLSHSEEIVATESEVLQKVTDYSAEELSKVSTTSVLKTTTPIGERYTSGSLHGAGDSSMVGTKVSSKSKTFSRIGSRSSRVLPPIDVSGSSKSHMSVISDCRLRNLRLDTQYEISPEKIDTPPGEIVKRK